MEKRWIHYKGRPRITIVTSADASEQEKYASQELKNYLELMTSAVIPLKTIGNESIQEPVIAVGKVAAKLGVQTDKLGIDDFSLQSIGNSLAIAGGKRGVIYGVYEFLEKLGCRFFTPLCEKVPSMPDLELPVLNETQSPVLEYRYHNYKDFTGYPRFAVKSRINGPVPIKEKFGGNMSYVWFVHTFERIISPEDWFDAHPEYFSMVNGKRIRERTQLCLTNPDVLDITIKKVKEALREHPECRLISVSQNDWGNNCECPECKKIDEKEGSSAGSLIHFVNKVAEAVEPEFPHVIIDTLAYQYTRPAPKYVRPRRNVCVRLCSIESCFAHSFETCDDKTRQVKRPDGSTSDFIHDLRDWAKVCDRLYIWDYTTCFAHYPAPFPNWNVLQPNMQAFAKNNVKGVFEQACGAKGGSVDLNELRAYLTAKLLWNPDCDLERHKSEFLDFYYGAAADHIREYLQVLTDKAEKDNIHVGFNDQTDKEYLADDMLDIYDSIFDRAEQAVLGDPIRAVRVAKARLSIRWVRLKNNAMLKGIKNPKEINKFFEDWRAHGLTRIDEWVSPETTHRALIEGRWRGTEYYKNWWEEGPEEL
ncbi:MAG: DUF4838 domain-containing protein [Caldicoprobacterales bacterium]|jgi:hypothetical protein